MPKRTNYPTVLEPKIKRAFQKIIAEHGYIEINFDGGTLSPIHYGHLIVAQNAMEQFNSHVTLWVPNGNPPHKPDTIDKEYRVKMTKAATKSNPRFFVTRIEADRPGLSYTNETLRQLREELGPKARFNLILGADNVAQLAGWAGGVDEIFKCRLLIAARQTADNNGGEAEDIVEQWRRQLPQAIIERIDCPMHSISSTKIRELVKSGCSIEYYVPPAVNTIIRKEKLYTPRDQQENIQ